MSELLLNRLNAHKQGEDNEDRSSFTITVRTGRQPKVIGKHGVAQLFKLTDSVKYVKEKYVSLMDDSFKLENIVLRHGRKGILLDNKTLKDYNDSGRALTLFITFTTIGGALQIESEYNFSKKSAYRNRNINNNNNKLIKLSNDECCIGLIKDSKNNAKMPCGHTINSQSMFEYLRTIVNRNSYEYQIICPVPQCNQEWDFQLCADIACLNDEEYSAFDNEFQKRALPEMKSCPNCENLCVKPDNLRYYRVSCSACRKYDWCWDCGQKWTGGGFTVCGNNNCPTADINDFLQNAEETTISGDIKVPALRACPTCYSLTAHASACKHMKCKECGQEFCFVCLRLKINNKWQCETGDSSSSNCGVASKQHVK